MQQRLSPTKEQDTPKVHRVLIVDDNPRIHEDLRKVLCESENESRAELDRMTALLFEEPTTQHSQRHTFEVSSAFSGEECLKMVEQALVENRPYMVAFMDVRMPPGMDGIETVSRAWELDPQLQIIMCTAFSDYSWDQAVDKLGQSDSLLFLKKPVDEVEVLQGAHAMARKWWLQKTLQSRMCELEVLVKERTRELETTNVSLRREISERQHAEEEFRFLATHDPLTRLANRVLLHDRLRHALEQARRYKHTVGVLLLDLDGFKAVNDTHGHRVGDCLLQEVATRLEELVRSSDTVARMGGDEFTVVIERVNDPVEAEQIAARVADSLRSPYQIDGKLILATASIGLSVYPRDAGDAETLLRKGDAAMYDAKQRGGGRWEASINLFNKSDVRIRDEICRAIEQKAFRLVYQPVVSFETGEIVSMEALARWSHPTLGELPPSYFIREAEMAGLMGPLGAWILDAACACYAAWKARGIAPKAMAVNISAAQLHLEDFASSVERTLAKHGLEPHQLELELTETAATENVERSVEALTRLHKLGVRIVIDDFGAGFSSLRRLKQFCVSALKVDRFFTENIASDPNDAAIVASIISMARSLGLEVVAEGIESSAQLEVLRSMADRRSSRILCDRLQGYLIARPLTAEVASKMLTAALGSQGLDTLIKITNDIRP